MPNLKSFLVLMLASILIVSCNPNDENIDTTVVDFKKNFGNPVTRNFLGQVVDENNNPIPNTSISIGTFNALTDINGVFIINDASVYERFAYITAKKTGYIDGSRAIVTTQGINEIKITMFTDNATATISSGNSSEVSLPNGTKVIFGGAFKTESGSAYSGSVRVILHYLDAADSKIANKMPGMLFGANSESQARVLETHGMINIELRGSGGEKLQVVNAAQIQIPISNAQFATAPASIPLWYFDETAGYWKQEGNASKQGNQYIGSVSHLAWWSGSKQLSPISLRLKLANNEGHSLANVAVGIRNNGAAYPVIGTTNIDGQLTSLVPANETLTMNIYDNCGNIVSTSSIGPFAINASIPNITVTNEMAPSSLVQGKLLKCDNSNVTNGYVLLKTNSETAVLNVSAGNLKFYTLVCNSDAAFALKGFDYDNFQGTDYIHYTHTAPITNTGNLKACNTITEFISYKIDNGSVKYIVDNFNVNKSANFLSISGNNIGSSPMDIYGQANSVGNYSTNQFTIESADVGIISSGSANTISFNINYIGAVGQYIDMTFNGTYTNGSATHTINGVVHVRRDN